MFYASAAALVTAPPPAAAIAFGPLLPEPVLAVATSDRMVAAIIASQRGRQVVLLAREPEQSIVWNRWPDQPARIAASDPAIRRHRADVDDVLSLYDLSEADREAPEFEDLLDEEGVDEKTRQASAGDDREPLSPRALAASATQIWMASTRGVWAVDTSGPGNRWRPRGLGERDVTHIAVGAGDDGRTVVAALSDDAVWSSDDDGTSWTLAGVVTAPPRALAVAPGGRQLVVATEDGLWLMSARRQPWRLSADGADDVVTCRRQVAALGHGTLSLFSDALESDPVVVAAVAVRAVRCPADRDGPWIGIGDSGLFSRDGGKAWTAIGDGALEISAAAIDGGEIWLGTPHGLFVGLPHPAAAPAVAEFSGPPARDPLDSDEEDLLSRRIARPPAWTSCLPRISLLGGLDVGGGQQTVRALLVLTIPLSRVARSRAANELAAEVTHRRVRSAVRGREETQPELHAVETLAETSP